jgi:hypothetical protein
LSWCCYCYCHKLSPVFVVLKREHYLSEGGPLARSLLPLAFRVALVEPT